MFYRKFISNRNEKTQILMNKPVYFGLLILDLKKLQCMNFGMFT